MNLIKLRHLLVTLCLQKTKTKKAKKKSTFKCQREKEGNLENICLKGYHMNYTFYELYVFKKAYYLLLKVQSETILIGNRARKKHSNLYNIFNFKHPKTKYMLTSFREI